ncbi:hypothetical protein MUO14_05765 [Halobacillus shinanisalinarum]|uniref:Uncharacterized protein n=1 Tax=Halobacillus shinanisalinarum TaxID=2932258 RepID=A0ABY4H2Q5_9BACI|nr:hypothetical protein [Halobacillus shinanisalinarum]UOQ94461.1 hypothetical protein MUO14_05765 [Halobacillus shinanisalinarum]
MKEMVVLLAEIVNTFHDIFLGLSHSLGWNLTDKELHFWIIGMLGIMCLIFVDVIFHALAKWSVTAISFLFTLSMVLVFVLAVEIQQKITGRGAMEFNDAAVSILGFLAFCTVYFLVKMIVKWIR